MLLEANVLTDGGRTEFRPVGVVSIEGQEKTGWVTFSREYSLLVIAATSRRVVVMADDLELARAVCLHAPAARYRYVRRQMIFNPETREGFFPNDREPAVVLNWRMLTELCAPGGSPFGWRRPIRA